MGEVSWETEIEMTEVLDVFRVSLTLSYDGNDEFEVEGGENTHACTCIDPHGRGIPIFATERGRLVDDKREKIEQMREERRRF